MVAAAVEVLARKDEEVVVALGAVVEEFICTPPMATCRIRAKVERRRLLL